MLPLIICFICIAVQIILVFTVYTASNDAIDAAYNSYYDRNDYYDPRY